MTTVGKHTNEEDNLDSERCFEDIKHGDMILAAGTMLVGGFLRSTFELRPKI